MPSCYDATSCMSLSIKFGVDSSSRLPSRADTRTHTKDTDATDHLIHELFSFWELHIRSSGSKNDSRQTLDTFGAGPCGPYMVRLFPLRVALVDCSLRSTFL